MPTYLYYLLTITSLILFSQNDIYAGFIPTTRTLVIYDFGGASTDNNNLLQKQEILGLFDGRVEQTRVDETLEKLTDSEVLISDPVAERFGLEKSVFAEKVGQTFVSWKRSIYRLTGGKIDIKRHKIEKGFVKSSVADDIQQTGDYWFSSEDGFDFDVSFTVSNVLKAIEGKLKTDHLGKKLAQDLEQLALPEDVEVDSIKMKINHDDRNGQRVSEIAFAFFDEGEALFTLLFVCNEGKFQTIVVDGASTLEEIEVFGTN